MNLIHDIEETLDKYRGDKDLRGSVNVLEHALMKVIEDQAPYKIAKVEFLLPADADISKLHEALSQLQNNCFNDPIAEWRMVDTESQKISGPDAEDRFDQPDLEYPGKQIVDRIQKMQASDG